MQLTSFPPIIPQVSMFFLVLGDAIVRNLLETSFGKMIGLIPPSRPPIINKDKVK